MKQFDAECEAQQEAAQELYLIKADDLAGQFNQYSVDELVNLVMTNKKVFAVDDGVRIRFVDLGELSKLVAQDAEFSQMLVSKCLYSDSLRDIKKHVDTRMRQHARLLIQEIKDDFHDYMQGGD